MGDTLNYGILLKAEQTPETLSKYKVISDFDVEIEINGETVIGTIVEWEDNGTEQEFTIDEAIRKFNKTGKKKIRNKKLKSNFKDRRRLSFKRYE